MVCRLTADLQPACGWGGLIATAAKGSLDRPAVERRPATGFAFTWLAGGLAVAPVCGCQNNASGHVEIKGGDSLRAKEAVIGRD